MLVDKNDIIVLILSTTHPKYQIFKKSIRETWAKDLHEKGIKCFFYEGGGAQNRTDGDTFVLNAPDDILSVSKKLVEALKFTFDLYPNVKVVYRTNLSSFIDVESFLRFINTNKLDEEIYAGYIGKESLFKERFYQFKLLYFIFKFHKFGRKIIFASGSGFFLGAKHCKRIITSNFNAGLVDDIMVAHTIKVLPSLSVTPLRLLVSSESRNSIDEKTFDHLVQEKNLFHYRFKTKDRNRDAELLRQFGDKSFRRVFFTGMKKM